MSPSRVQRQEAYLSRDSFSVISNNGHLINPRTLGNCSAFQDNKGSSVSWLSTSKLLFKSLGCPEGPKWQNLLVHFGIPNIDVHVGGGFLCMHGREWRKASYMPGENISLDRSEGSSSARDSICMPA